MFLPISKHIVFPKSLLMPCHLCFKKTRASPFRLLELWQRVSSGGQAGFKLSLQTRAAFSQLPGSDLSSTALWALLKVIAAESPGTDVSGFDADVSRALPSLPLHVSLALPKAFKMFDVYSSFEIGKSALQENFDKRDKKKHR
jgi:hypothetical protein